MAENNVSTPLPEYTAHQESLKLINTLMGGTAAMRGAGTTYLPQEPAESTDAYPIRLGRTTLFNAFKRTVQKLTGEVFCKDVDVGEDVPPQVAEWASEDIDLQGRNLSRFAQKVFMAGLRDGVTHILADYPQADGVATLADEKAAAIRPYWVHIEASRLIGWRFETVNGKRTLVQVRITEVQTVPDGDYATKNVNRIRVLNQDSFEIWEEHADDKGESEWVLVQEGIVTLGFIPLATFMFGEQVSEMTADPPLDDLAELNLAHWKLDSDYRTTLHQMVPIWFGKGITDATGKGPGEGGSQVIVGAGRLIHSMNTEADLKGIALESGPAEAMKAELAALEDKMALFGLTLMLPKGGQITATQAGQDKSENDSALRGWAMVFKDGLELALQYMARWAKLGDKGGTLIVNTDFRAFSGLDVTVLTTAMVAGKIPMGLWLKELQRRGVVEDDVDETEVLAMLTNEVRNTSLGGLSGSFLSKPTPAAPGGNAPPPPQAASRRT